MKYIYVFKKNDYAALLAAYIHLKMDYKHIKTKAIEPMKLFFMGIDHKLNEVYIIKSSCKIKILINILNGLATIFNHSIIIINLSKYDSFFYRINKKELNRSINKRMLEWRL
ncbi:DUF3189 family protein [Alkaliphilus pronyensis]|uniref:DUF3189 family protein n=1 Tax=Alkaliphilus pronyensis TaxID=1482732 RepID=A0A6I0F7E1_9FIRM|nr:DUF3189 family protein [Alkaliphilus pronyensis]KAB3538560.1 DUF3189 family protein [Alkaliphilus pronyensis]